MHCFFSSRLQVRRCAGQVYRSKIYVTLSRVQTMHARNACRRRHAMRPRDAGTGTLLQKLEKPFHAKKTAKNLPHDALQNTCVPFFVFSVLFFVLSKVFFGGEHLTDRLTGARFFF